MAIFGIRLQQTTEDSFQKVGFVSFHFPLKCCRHACPKPRKTSLIQSLALEATTVTATSQLGLRSAHSHRDRVAPQRLWLKAASPPPPFPSGNTLSLPPLAPQSVCVCTCACLMLFLWEFKALGITAKGFCWKLTKLSQLESSPLQILLSMFCLFRNILQLDCRFLL